MTKLNKGHYTNGYKPQAYNVKPLEIRPPSCWHCGQLLEWKDITCPKCGKTTPHEGEDWNIPFTERLKNKTSKPES